MRIILKQLEKIFALLQLFTQSPHLNPTKRLWIVVEQEFHIMEPCKVYLQKGLVSAVFIVLVNYTEAFSF